MSGFGRDDPRQMPPHFFQGSLRLDYSSAVRADAEAQSCSICPRYWYVDAHFRCARCDGTFAFSAAEQRTWYEEYGFWVDSLPKHCAGCRNDLRDLKRTRQEYDHSVAAALDGSDPALKRRLAAVIDRLYELGGPLPKRITDNRRRLALQMERSGHGAA